MVLGNAPAAWAGNPANLLFPLDGSFTRADFFGDGCTGNRCASGADQHNDDDSVSVTLPFGFDLYGEQFTSAYVNNNGNLSFGSYFSTFTSSGFPNSNFKMVAGFWGDIDTGDSTTGLGDVWQKLSSNTLVVVWDNVGYFNRQGDKRNTFEIAISDGTNPTMGLGNNVCLSYDDMQWTTGNSSGGSGGFGGTPATVGANRGNGVDFFQIGRFDHDGNDYDGPSNNADGVNYLDGRLFCFRTSTTTTNIAPIATGFPAGNLININPQSGGTLDLTLSFLSPEAGQTTTVQIVDDNNAAARGLSIFNTPGNVASIDLDWTPTCAAGGNYRLEFTARDDFNPSGETEIALTIHVACEPTVTPLTTATPTPTITPAPGCSTYFGGDLPKTITDFGEVTSTVVVAQTGRVAAIDILSLRGTHSFVQDLEFHLVSPSGTDVNFMNRVCGGSQDFDLNLDDLAATMIPCPPTDGQTHLPSNPLAAFDGESTAGTWALRINDRAELDGGTLNSWGLQVCFEAGTATPAASATPTRTHTATVHPSSTSTPTPTRTATGTSSPTPTITAAPGCQTYFADGLPRAIPDLGTIESSLASGLTGTVSSVSILSLHGSHSFVQDLEFHLISPSGREVTVVNRVCGGSDDFNLNLDDLAATTIPCPPTDGGFHLPSFPLDAFAGDLAGGTWRLRVSDRELFDDGVLDGWSLQLCGGTIKPTLTPTPAVTPTCGEYFATGLPASIPDLGSLSSPLFVPLSGSVSSVSVRSLAGTHTFMQDLEFHLISPVGTDVTLINRVCGGSSGFQFEVDDLGVPIFCPPFDALPHYSYEPLSTFVGQNPVGTWTLQVFDRAILDDGVVHSWGLYICVDGAPTPQPTPTGSQSQTFTRTPSRTRTFTPTITLTPEPFRSATPTHTPTMTFPPPATFTYTPTRSPSLTPTGTRPATPTFTPTSTPTLSLTPTNSPTSTRPPKLTFTPTRTPSVTATASTMAASATPTQTPTGSVRPPKITFTPTRTTTITPTIPGGLTATPTATRTGGSSECKGDCDASGEVSMGDLIRLIELALDQPGQAPCTAGDVDGDGHIRIEEVVRAVDSAADGCVAAATPTPTRTGAAAGTLTPTRTTSPQAGDVARPGTGAAVVVAQSLRAIPALISSLTQLARASSRSAENGFPRAVSSCNAGGTRDFVCTQSVAGVPPRDYTLSFAGCGLNTAGGSKVIVDGSMSGRSTESGFLASCSLPPLSLATMTLSNVRVQVRNAQSQSELDATFNLTGSAVATPDLASSCRISAFEMTVSGSAVIDSAGLHVDMGFNATRMKIDVQQFSADCVPVRYALTVNGPLSINTSAFGEFAATYTDFVFGDDTSSGSDLVTLNGGLQSACFPAPITYATDTALALVRTDACPIAGALRLSAGASTDRVAFGSGGSVQIDRSNNGSVDETYPNCAAAELAACPP